MCQHTRAAYTLTRFPVKGIDTFGYSAQQPSAGPTPAFLGEWPHQPPFPNEAATEVLRRLASRYLNQRDAHVYVFRIEPCPAGGFRVEIILELAHLFCGFVYLHMYFTVTKQRIVLSLLATRLCCFQCTCSYVAFSSLLSNVGFVLVL